MEEEGDYFPPEPKISEPIPVCQCLKDDEPSSDKHGLSAEEARKQKILSTVTDTEHYLRSRRIPDLIRYFLTKILARTSDNPKLYLEKLLDDCMLFRAGLGKAPVLYKGRHLEAIVRSFDPGNRGWLSAGQVRRAFNTLGLTPVNVLEDQIPTDVVLDQLALVQEKELFNLLTAGSKEDLSLASSSTCRSTNSSPK